MDESRVKQIQAELKAVGVGKIGLKTPEAHYLAAVLQPDEHIGGAIYGRTDDSLAWLVATDRRVIYIDKKPLYTSSDELTYDVVAGVQKTRAGLFTAVVLHTRLGNYVIRFVNSKCARIFVDYIDQRRLASAGGRPVAPRFSQIKNDTAAISSEARAFVREHELAVLSTLDRTGNVHGAVVYYITDQDDHVYVITKSGTGKGRNVYGHGQVALTIYEPGTMQTAQLQGLAEVETDQAVKERVFGQIVRPRSYRDGQHMPPVTKLHDGGFMVIRVTPQFISYHDYAKQE